MKGPYRRPAGIEIAPASAGAVSGDVLTRRTPAARETTRVHFELAWGAGHMIQIDRPDLVIAATRRLVDAARVVSR